MMNKYVENIRRGGEVGCTKCSPREVLQKRNSDELAIVKTALELSSSVREKVRQFETPNAASLSQGSSASGSELSDARRSQRRPASSLEGAQPS